MRRISRPSVESLEGKNLLSAVLSPISPGSPTSAPNLSATLTAVASTTSTGPQVVATFTETNKTSQPVTIAVGPSIDGFVASKGGVVVWESNAGPEPLYVTLETLAPGRSFSISATWGGQTRLGSAPASGTYTISNELDPKVSATVTIPKVAAIPKSNSPTIGHPGGTPSGPVSSPATPVPRPSTPVLSVPNPTSKVVPTEPAITPPRPTLHPVA